MAEQPEPAAPGNLDIDRTVLSKRRDRPLLGRLVLPSQHHNGSAGSAIRFQLRLGRGVAAWTFDSRHLVVTVRSYPDFPGAHMLRRIPGQGGSPKQIPSSDRRDDSLFEPTPTLRRTSRFRAHDEDDEQADDPTCWTGRHSSATH